MPNLLRVSAASILLVGLSVAGAQERADLSSAREAESEVEPGWAGKIRREGSIMAQANAVFAALRSGDDAADGFEPVPETVEVADLDVESNAVRDIAIRDGNGSEGCIFMERPGSRIRKWRCYYPDAGEQALNEYQFREEIRLIVRQQEQMEILRQEIETRIATGQ